MPKGSESRAIALDMLMEITEGGAYSHQVIRGVLEKYRYMDKRDRALMKRLTEGTLERMLQIDYLLDQVSSVPVCRMKPLIRNLLRMSAYQILFLEQVPDRAACSEAVLLAQRRGFRQLSGFVNGVLRGLIRSREQLVYPDRESEPLRFLSVRYSMPQELAGLWLAEYGMAQTERMLRQMLQESPLTVRVRESLPEKKRAQAEAELAACGAARHPYLPCAYRLPAGVDLAGLRAFADGSLYAQDVSSMLAAECAGIRAGDRVLDVCAAPGGKSFYAADRLLALQRESGSQQEGLVEARDVSEEKTALLQENRARLGLTNVTVRRQDASVPSAADGQADVLLLDVPCSGWGVIGRKQDIKYRVSQEKLASLERLQKAIVRESLPLVRPGGTVLYSTCTIHRAENEDMRAWMLREFPLREESLDPYLPEALRGKTTAQGYLQLLPGLHECDGFFIARFRRRAD